MNTNNENPRVGKRFQIAVKEWFEKETGITTNWNIPLR